jgi:hypothetical protein
VCSKHITTKQRISLVSQKIITNCDPRKIIRWIKEAFCSPYSPSSPPYSSLSNTSLSNDFRCLRNLLRHPKNNFKALQKIRKKHFLLLLLLLLLLRPFLTLLFQIIFQQRTWLFNRLGSAPKTKIAKHFQITKKHFLLLLLTFQALFFQTIFQQRTSLPKRPASAPKTKFQTLPKQLSDTNIKALVLNATYIIIINDIWFKSETNNNFRTLDLSKQTISPSSSLLIIIIK